MFAHYSRTKDTGFVLKSWGRATDLWVFADWSYATNMQLPGAFKGNEKKGEDKNLSRRKKIFF